MAVQRLKIFLLATALFLLASCSASDEMVAYSDDVVSLFGDDILKYSSQYASTSDDDYLQALSGYGDDLSRLTNQSLDDSSRLAANKYLQSLSQELGMLDNIPGTTGSEAASLLFRANPDLTPMQEDVLQYFMQSGLVANENEPALLLESACLVDWKTITNKILLSTAALPALHNHTSPVGVN